MESIAILDLREQKKSCPIQDEPEIKSVSNINEPQIGLLHYLVRKRHNLNHDNNHG